MKICVECGEGIETVGTQCAHCGATSPTIEGFLAFAPEFALESPGFKASYFSDLILLEEKNFWFRARAELILWLFARCAEGFQNYLEVGCGTGHVLSAIHKKYPDRNLSGSEIFVSGLHFAKSRVPRCHFYQMDAQRIPFKDEFDVIGAYDVIEHIENDELVLKQIFNALTSNGVLILTVPQHPWLWSKSDDYACHIRRYTSDELHKKLKRAGFEIIRSFSFVSSLLPLMMLSRLIDRSKPLKDYDPKSELRIPPFLNSIFLFFLRLETILIRWGLSFPFGGSRIVVARKKH